MENLQASFEEVHTLKSNLNQNKKLNENNNVFKDISNFENRKQMNFIIDPSIKSQYETKYGKYYLKKFLSFLKKNNLP